MRAIVWNLTALPVLVGLCFAQDAGLPIETAPQRGQAQAPAVSLEALLAVESTAALALAAKPDRRQVVELSGSHTTRGRIRAQLSMTPAPEGAIDVKLALSYLDEKSFARLATRVNPTEHDYWDAYGRLDRGGAVDALTGEAATPRFLTLRRSLGVSPQLPGLKIWSADADDVTLLYRSGWPLPVTDARYQAVLAKGDPGYADTVQVRYLGTGGYHIRLGDDEILTGPYFSNHSFAEVLPIPEVPLLFAKERAIDRGMGLVEGNFAQGGHAPRPRSNIAAILVGHAHYDHLVDVPYVARKHAKSAVIYGSSTVKNILAGDEQLDPSRVVAVNAQQDRWIEIPRTKVRIMPLRSEHGPHLWPMIKLMPDGRVEEPRKELKHSAAHWPEGQVFAYLIDLRDELGNVRFRIHYSDATHGPQYAIPPKTVLAERRVDLAIVCVPTANLVERYPEALLEALRPRQVLLGHWEQFFVPHPAQSDVRVVPIPGFPVNGFIRSVERTAEEQGLDDLEWTLPRPGSLLRYRAARWVH